MYNRFKELGVPVALTRTGDTTLDASDRPSEALNKFGSDSNVLIISNHINAGGSDISNYEGLNFKKLFTTTFLIFFSTATWAWFIPANFSFWWF